MLDGDFTTAILRLGLATVLGVALGLERERHCHDAGLRTHGLVALSSGMLTLSALEMVEHHGQGDPVRVIQGLAQAIGFIAGGLIFVRGGDVRNMTTATSLWMAAAVGITAAAGQYGLVLTGTALALALLGAATAVEKPLPRQDKSLRSGEQGQMPNRRGALPQATQFDDQVVTSNEQDKN
ncbi:MgtC/SapB family protein [Novosphingobium sp. 9]|uniref:MgtC/SapB family protein n=1 Tax=Novosphingobium sp. 9 TaxID=2025349 RepID=UPI0021B59067|nr:MgtC/SapB family protein [Novosphingobium sp. 9]